MRSPSKYALLLLVFAACTSQKKLVKEEDSTLSNLQKHIGFLADDKLEGRRAGSAGEKLAREYIAGQFSSIGITPKGTDGFYQPFQIYEGKQSTASQVSINGNVLEPGMEYFVFPFSANKKTEARPAIAVQEHSMPWFYDLKEILDENKNNPHFDLADYVYNNSKKAGSRGASAVILFNSSATDDKLAFNAKDKSETLTIPVIYVKKPAVAKYFKDPAATLDIKIATEINAKNSTGHNVVGYIDNGAATTVVLGAHFDHLGFGDDGNSRDVNHEKAIHNGADDNASGTAALIELARQLKKQGNKNKNYLFIAFSGEELGLFGSKYFVDNPTLDLKTVDYMINMDMVGRLNDSSKVVTLGGIGTSPIWPEVVTSSNTSNTQTQLVIKYDSSGTGPSDHTSFYRKDIPVLFYFTGLHTDYHKPTDDSEKINYAGEQAIIQHILKVVNAANSRGKIVFTKTRETQVSTNASWKVTLGIMPDYTFTGTGVRADGVTAGRAAANAGLKGGDIILQLGEYNTGSMEAYMQTLSKFKKGDKTKVKYKRGNEVLEAAIEF